MLEDTIELKEISLPSPKVNIDTSYFLEDFDQNMLETQTLSTSSAGAPSIVKTVPIPSPTTIKSVRKALIDSGGSESAHHQVTKRHLVQLDWVSMEDGSHILTVAVGSKVILYTAVSIEIANALKKDNKTTTQRPR